jgi:hypothetical protein
MDGRHKQENVPLPGGQHVGYHYHDVEEWLEVLEGEISFFPVGELESAVVACALVEGEVLKIPRGEIHRVEIGPHGVKYNMWVPVYVEPFMNMLNDEEISLIRKNLKLPIVENQWDARDPNVPVAQARSREKSFLEDLVSEDLMFRTASGKLLIGKMAYLERPPAEVIREASNSVRILHKSPESMLLSTVVHTQPKEGGSRKSFSNIRLFVKENDIWKCRVWINHPELGAS